MNIRRKSKTEKLEISFRDLPIVLIRAFNYFHDLASLNTLNSLKALKADIAPLPELSSPLL